MTCRADPSVEPQGWQRCSPPSAGAVISHMNRDGSLHGGSRWNSTVESMLVSGALGAAFGGAGALLAGAGGRRAAVWAGVGFAGGLPDGGWLHLFTRPGRDGLQDLGSWVRGDVPR